MRDSIPSVSVRRGTPHASLAALGVKLCQLDLLAPIRASVKIHQKRVKFSPFEKLCDCWIGILAGAHGIVEIDDRLRADPALQAAFGRTGCAEQSVIQDTLDACTPENVTQMEQALGEIFRQHSHASRHDFAAAELLLDADLSGMPCGRKAALATKGYFAGEKNRRGRQLGRVLASDYDEVVLDQLYAGNTALVTAFPSLMETAETRLGLTEEQRARTILRVDAGGGSIADLNWALERGYQVHAKDYCRQRAERLAASVQEWYEDPKVPGRQIGRVTLPATEYVRPVRRVAVRCPTAKGEWKAAVLISTVDPTTVLARAGTEGAAVEEAQTLALADAAFYDQRGGGVETSLKGDKQGLGITKRNKKRFAAQQMLVQLAALAHNVVVWGRDWLRPAVETVSRLGIQRMVRDVFGIAGAVEIDRSGHVSRLIFNQASRLAHRYLTAFQLLLGAAHVDVILGET
jgi:hypothetical protein